MREILKRNGIGNGPFCKAFVCLWTRRKLEEGILPDKITALINWAIDV